MDKTINYPDDICNLHTQQQSILDAYLNDKKHFFAVYAHRRLGCFFLSWKQFGYKGVINYIYQVLVLILEGIRIIKEFIGG